MFSLAGKTAVVTGAGRGIGKAIAIGLARQGASVVLASRSMHELQSVCSGINRLGGKSLHCRTDVTSERDVEELIAVTLNAYGSLDILVNNAGVSPLVSRPEKLKRSDWDKILAINLTGAFLCAREAGKVMITNRKGCIINISSISSAIALPGLVAYSASKGGMVMLTKELAYDWAEHNIRVNAVAPGIIETDLNKQIREAKGKFYEYFISRTPMKRLGTPEEVVGAVIFLSSDEASYITGQVLFVDGGMSVG